jgi:hypothetical protein
VLKTLKRIVAQGVSLRSYELTAQEILRIFNICRLELLEEIKYITK